MVSQQNVMQMLFEFPNKNGNKQPISFHDPEEVVTADKTEDVLPALEKIQKAVQNGYYAAGYLSYEAAPSFDDAYSVNPDVKMPILLFGLFRESNSSEPSSFPRKGFRLSEWETETDFHTFKEDLTRIKEAIGRGETYQVNYTLRMRSSFSGDAYSFYKKLTETQSGYNAYLDLGRYQILSASPELFFHLKGRRVITRPMKGTASRGRWAEEEAERVSWLHESVKNRAENVMIVDLLRNDLGEIAEAGSVQVTSLFDVEKYPTVLQMTSTIEAVLKENITIKELFGALFPCGSITGAPKVSTMNWIRELENAPREVYCGAIGYFNPNGEAVFNVPIRTVVVDTELGTAEYGVGSGITWNSTAEEEMSEVQTKAKLLTQDRPKFDLLESLKLENGQYVLYKRHLQRLKRSADFFLFLIGLEKVEESLSVFAKEHQSGCWKVRLISSEKGEVHVEGAPIKELSTPMPIAMAKTAISKEDLFLYHKTTYRSTYEHHRSGQGGEVFDVLLWNEQGELTEFTNGNLVLKLDGKLWTPARESGLLNGTFRDELLSNGVIQERILTKKDLDNGSAMWLINSVRGWVKVYIN